MIDFLIKRGVKGQSHAVIIPIGNSLVTGQVPGLSGKLFLTPREKQCNHIWFAKQSQNMIAA